jgi:SPX domain protein involved in polyphosphate accumulation
LKLRGTLKSISSDTTDPRYERKYVVSGLSCHQVQALVKLHPAMFSEIYSTRFVNNLYFDSPNMWHHYSSIQGLSDRVKVRIRWYGDLFGHVERPALELKFKRGSIGRKEVYPLPQICIDGSLQKDALLKIFKQSDIPDSLKHDLMPLGFSLLNRYQRTYFQSMDGRYRITLDTGIEYYYIQGHSNTFLHKSINLKDSVVELKYDPEEDEGADHICQKFPFRMTKSSKYVNGIESLSLW